MIYVYKDRIVNIEWTVLKGTSNVKENFDRVLVKMFLIGPHEKYVLNANAVDGVVSAEVPQGLPEGVYSVEIIYIKNWLGVDRAPDRPRRFPVDCRGNDRCIMRTRKDNLFGITEYESEATNVGEGEVVVRVKTSTASYGYDGLSAYEIAVMRGDFEGTEGEWLEWTHERIVTDVRDLLDKMKSRDTRFVVRTKDQRDSLKDLREGDEVYVIDDGMSYVLRMEGGQRVWHAQDYGSVTAKYMLSMIADLPNFVADRAVADEFGKRIVDEYLTRDAVRRYMSEVFKDLFIENPPTIMDGMITVDMLSDAVKQLIGFGPIVNFPDDEFLTTKNGRITLKDRNYDPNNYSGMGRKVLRKNMVNGVNVLTQRMVSCPNTVYVITYDFDLRGEEITVPEGCVLEFQGGSLNNGTIAGAGTSIKALPSETVFNEIVISGSWNVPFIYDTWFYFNRSENYPNNVLIKSILNLSNKDIHNTIYFSSGRTYWFENPYNGKANLGDDVRPMYGKLMSDEYSFLRIFTEITSNTRIFIDSDIRMIPHKYGACVVFYIADKSNIEICGTGSIHGDVHGHIYDDPFVSNSNYYGEWGHLITLASCHNVVIRDITLSGAFGDAISIGSHVIEVSEGEVTSAPSKGIVNDPSEGILVDNVNILYARRNGISVGGHNVSIVNCHFKGCGSDEIKGTAPKCGIDFENDYRNINSECVCRNVIMSNCKFEDNAYDISSTGATFENAGEYAVCISNCVFKAPLRLNSTNWIKFSNCYIPAISEYRNQIGSFTTSSHIRYENCQFEELYPYLQMYAEKYKHEFVNCDSINNISGRKVYGDTLGKEKVIKMTIPISLPEQALVTFTTFANEKK